MNRFGINIKFSRTKYGLALAAIFGIAMFLRVYFPYDNVFAGGWVNFQETDCWYQMRQLEIVARNFPHRMLFDPYNFYPGGAPISSPPFFYLFLGFFSWLFGAGSPTLKVIETVGAYLPAILGALVTVPVYFIGKELFNRQAGLLAAALIAILPGQFLWRSMLGFPDYHIAESLFSATAMMFLIMAVKSSEQKGISFESLRQRDWGTLRRPLLYALLAGIALGVYLLTWSGGGLFIFIIFVFAVIQFVMDHLRGKSSNYLCIVGAFSFFIALLMLLPSWGKYSMWNLQSVSLLIGLIVFLALGVLSSLMAGRNIGKIWYPLALVVLGGIGAVLFYFADHSLFSSIWDKLHVFTPSSSMRTVAEVQSIWPWADNQGLSEWYETLWDQFTISFYLAFISLIILAYFVIRKGDADKTLLFVWSLVILVATFSQNRFAYYFAVNVALLAAYLSWRVLQFAGLREARDGVEVAEDIRDKRSERESAKTKQVRTSRQRKGKAKKREQRVLTTRHLSGRSVYVSLTLIVVFFLAFYFNIGEAIDRVKGNTGVNGDWHESLVWMRENTPDPFNNPDSYYEIAQKPSAGEAYQYPDSAYGVMSWWDYGYWITYIAHRIPNANPSQSGAVNAGLFFTAQDEASGSQVLDRLGSKYIVIDSDMAVQSLKYGGKFYAMVTWAGKDLSQFFDDFIVQSTSTGTQVVRYYYPEYYQSMCSRLYFYAGEEWVPQQVLAISWTVRQFTGTDGSTFTAKLVSDQQYFSTYESAKSFVDAHQDYRIVGTSELGSPVPLEKLEHYKLIHQSPTMVATQPGGNGTISSVEIFEYSP